jgi:cyanate permease
MTTAMKVRIALSTVPMFFFTSHYSFNKSLLNYCTVSKLLEFYIRKGLSNADFGCAVFLLLIFNINTEIIIDLVVTSRGRADYLALLM